MGAIAGFGGRVTSNGVALPCGRWTVSWRGENVDVSTFEHGIGKEFMITAYDWDVTFDCFWDTGVDTFLPLSADLSPGGVVTQYVTDTIEVKLTFCLGNVNREWDFTHFLVENVSNDDEVRGVIRYTVSGRPTFPVTFAAGSAIRSGTVTIPGNSTFLNALTKA